MKRILFGIGLLAAFGAGCNQQTLAPRRTPVAPTTTIQSPTSTSTPTITSSPTTDEFSGWQTYSDAVRGFSVKYPAQSPVDLTSVPITLPQAIGGKERQLKLR